jgi:hypothetical protein
MTAPTPTWDEFAAALRFELARLGDGVQFVISSKDQPWHFAQFSQYRDQLFAEVTGETVQSPPMTMAETPQGRRHLESHGWSPPSRTEGYLWHRFVDYPPTSAEYREVVDAVVNALRDVNGVPSPDRLLYRAWDGNNGNEAWPVELPGVDAEPSR